MSRPSIGWPTSARSGALPVFCFFAAICTCLLITYFVNRLPGAGNKKPTTVSSRGFLSKSFSVSTKRHGAAYDDDPKNKLSNYFHLSAEISHRERYGQAQFPHPKDENG